MKKVLTLCSIAIVLLCVTTALNAATITVTKTEDTNDGICDSDCSFREAVAAAVAGDTIEFASPLFDTAQTIVNNFPGVNLSINTSLTINGRGSDLTIFSGGGSRQALAVVGAGTVVTINSVKITGGRIPAGAGSGGGLINSVTVNLNNSEVSGNSSWDHGFGAGIYNFGTMNISNSSIRNNTIAAGGFLKRGAGIFNNASGTMVLTDSVVYANTIPVSGQTADGGGIYNAGSLTIARTSVVGNLAVSNIGSAYGGGIFNSGTLDVESSSISENSITAGGDGGGIHNNGGTVRLRNVTLSSNATYGATQSDGGGIFTYNGILVAHNTTMTANYAGRYAGGIRNIFSSTPIYFANTIVAANVQAANSSNIDSGGYNDLGGNFINGNPRLMPLAYNGGPTATHLPFSDSPIINAGSNCILTDNGCGGGHPPMTTDQRGVGFTRHLGSQVDIGATESLRVVSNGNNSGEGSLRQAIASATAGETIGFAPEFASTPLTVALTGGEILIDKNIDIVGPGANLVSIDAGNASRIFQIQLNRTLTVTGLKITRGNVGGANGGCVYAYGVFNMINGEISNCSANFGGGIYNDSTGTANIVGSVMHSNQSTTHGAAIFSDGTTLITNSTIRNNTAGNAGAGIFLQPGRTATVTNSTIASNTALAGAGLYNLGTANLTGTTISGNIAQIGGGIFGDGTTQLFQSTVSGNTATSNKGAGIYNAAGRITYLLNSTITANYGASFAGAGIWNENFSFPTPSVRSRNSIIAGNHSDVGNPMDYVGDLTNLGNSIVNNSNPGLAPLGNYGGATQTHALLQSSIAINAGDNCVLTANSCGFGHAAFSNDQRSSNSPRSVGTNVDIGAFERNISFTPSTLPSSIQNYTYNQQVTPTRLSGFAGGNLAPFTYSIISGSLPPGLSLNSSTGAITGSLTQAGTFSFTIKVVDTDGVAGVQAYGIQVFGPTSANVSVSGRALTPDGRGLRDAIVTLMDNNGSIRNTRSSSFGYYQFDDVESGRTYVLSVISKRFTFSPRVLTVNEELSNIDLIADGSSELWP